MKPVNQLLSKVICFLLILFIAVPSYNIAFAAEAQSSASAQSEDAPDFDVWLANTSISGLEGDGNGAYTTFSGFSDPLYKELGGYLLEDEPLYILSAEWSGMLNDDFKKNPNYAYEAILMDYLMYSVDSTSTDTELLEQTTKYGKLIYSELAEKFGDNWRDIVAKYPIEDLKKFYQNCQTISGINKALEEVGSFASSTKELTELICDYLALQDVKESRIELLQQARTACANLENPNNDFIKAADKMIEIMDGQALSYIQDKSLQYVWGVFLDSCWSAIVKTYPALDSVEVGKQTMDGLFNSTDVAANNLKLAMLYTCDYYFQTGMTNACGNFIKNESAKTAKTFNHCFSAYVEFQMCGNKFAQAWIEDVVKGGLLNSIFINIFYRENIEGSKGLIELCKAQIDLRKSLLNLIQKYANVYNNKYKIDEWDSWINSDGAIPVTSVSFNSSTVYINQKEDIYLAEATVLPANATNRTVTYTSSDSSVLSVPENGGFGTVKGNGTVTVTATAADGGQKATQKVVINIDDKEPLSETASGTCGAKLRWVLYSNGVLHITGSGEMTAYGCINPGWYECRTLIKSVLMDDSVESIGAWAFHGCSSLSSITIPEGVTSIRDGAFSGCSSLSSITIPEGVTIIC
ncbi:leucine-rich repeat protein, partial [bacterium 210820-DFI.6.37]|nr:leucine-rich repeat protein [bacterium 210820-DFI.6.37]